MNLHSYFAAAGVIAMVAFGGASQAATIWTFDYTTPSNGNETILKVTTDTTPVKNFNFNDAAGLGLANGGLYIGGRYVPVSELSGYGVSSITGSVLNSSKAVIGDVTGMYGYPGGQGKILQSLTGYIFDNIAYKTQGLPIVDVLGLEFTVNGNPGNLGISGNYNFYSTINNGSGPGYMENVIKAVLNNYTADSSTRTGNQVSAVPVPAALPLFGSALIGFGALARRRTKKGELLAKVPGFIATRANALVQSQFFYRFWYVFRGRLPSQFERIVSSEFFDGCGRGASAHRRVAWPW